MGPVNAEINTYSGTTSGSDFGSPINTFNPAHDLDQPWIRTGPSGHVYVAYNDLTSAGTDAGGTGNGETAYVLVSTNGGSGYTPVALDRVGATNYQDAPAVRLAVNGGTVYAAFTHWTSVYDSNADETRYNGPPQYPKGTLNQTAIRRNPLEDTTGGGPAPAGGFAGRPGMQ